MSFKSLKSARTLTRHIGSAALAAAICVAATPSSAQAAALTHRWSFNTDGYDYTDSITGAAPASKFGNDGSRKTQGGKLVLTGSGSGQGSLGLGKNLLGSGDATVEIWASHDAAKNHARVFDYGNGSYGRNPNQTDCFIFAWSAGTEVSRDIVLLKKANATAFERHGTMSAMEWGKQYYFAVTFKDNGDGSSTITFRNPDTFAPERTITVTLRGQKVMYLNELEYIKGEIWANVYGTDQIVRINPQTGTVTGVINCRGLLPVSLRKPSTDVLNGIAVDARGGIWLTGKYWPKMYRITLVEKK